MINFANEMAKVKPQAVQGMIVRIANALNKRAEFERTKNPTKVHVELQAAYSQMMGNKTLARFYCVLNASPDLVLNRVRKDGYRDNLKTVRKVRMLAEFMAGDHSKMNGVCKALFAATILADRMGCPWVSNNDAIKLLLQMPVDGMGEELKSAFEELKGLSIKSPSEANNQACQFRTAFENLGCYFVSRQDSDDLSSNGIYANRESPLIMALAARWGL